MSKTLKGVLAIWSLEKYRDVMLPGLGSKTCGDLAAAIERLTREPIGDDPVVARNATTPDQPVSEPDELPVAWINRGWLDEILNYDGPAAGKQGVLWFAETDRIHTEPRVPLFLRAALVKPEETP